MRSPKEIKKELVMKNTIAQMNYNPKNKSWSSISLWNFSAKDTVGVDNKIQPRKGYFIAWANLDKNCCSTLEEAIKWVEKKNTKN